MHDELLHFLFGFETIIFDLDGVILDSAQLKVACMRSALSDFDNDTVARYLHDFTKKFGQSRVFHFRNFYHNYLNEQGDFDRFYQRYATRYAEILADCYPDAELCEHAEHVIKLLSHYGINLFVATGTSTQEAEKVLSHKQLKQYFLGIYGSPLEKTDIVKKIFSEHDFKKNSSLLIGDAIHDRDSAFSNDIPFLFVERYALVKRHALAQNFNFPFYAVPSLHIQERVELV